MEVSKGKIFIKEYSPLGFEHGVSVANNKGDAVMALKRYGKGLVLAIGDPWVYNEYLDGRKLPAEYQNYQAADDLVKWLIKQSR